MNREQQREMKRLDDIVELCQKRCRKADEEYNRACVQAYAFKKKCLKERKEIWK